MLTSKILSDIFRGYLVGKRGSLGVVVAAKAIFLIRSLRCHKIDTQVNRGDNITAVVGFVTDAGWHVHHQGHILLRSLAGRTHRVQFARFRVIGQSQRIASRRPSLFTGGILGNFVHALHLAEHQIVGKATIRITQRIGKYSFIRYVNRELVFQRQSACIFHLEVDNLRVTGLPEILGAVSLQRTKQLGILGNRMPVPLGVTIFQLYIKVACDNLVFTAGDAICKPRKGGADEHCRTQHD